MGWTYQKRFAEKRPRKKRCRDLDMFTNLPQATQRVARLAWSRLDEDGRRCLKSSLLLLQSLSVIDPKFTDALLSVGVRSKVLLCWLDGPLLCLHLEPVLYEDQVWFVCRDQTWLGEHEFLDWKQTLGWVANRLASTGWVGDEANSPDFPV